MSKYRLTVVSIVCLGVALLFLMGVFIALMSGASLPCSARHVFVPLVGFLVAGAWGFMGAQGGGDGAAGVDGTAAPAAGTAEGPVPGKLSVKFKLSGGIVGFVVGCVAAFYTYRCDDRPVELTVISAQGAAGSEPGIRQIEVNWKASHLPPGGTLMMEKAAGSGPGSVDWENAQTVVLPGPEGEIITTYVGSSGAALYVRLVVRGGPKVKPSEPTKVVFSQP